MNEKINRDMFRESLDRCSSGVHADPFLAGRVIAAGKGEKKMKKKMFTSIALALVILFALAAVAYSATTIYRRVNYKGETVETPDGYETHEYPEKARDYDAMCDELIDQVPDEECGIFQVTVGPGHYVNSEHKKQVQFSSFDDFARYMEEADPNYLMIPAWLPDYRTFYARVEMDLKEDGSYERVAYMTEGDAAFGQYRFEEGSEIITGYIITLDGEDEDACVEIMADMSDSTGEMRFALQDGETGEPVKVKGADDALLIRSSIPQSRNRLYLRSGLDKEIMIKTPDCLLTENPDPKRRENYSLNICAAVLTQIESQRDPEILLKIFNGE